MNRIAVAQELVKLARELVSDDESLMKAIHAMKPAISGWKASYEYDGFILWSKPSSSFVVAATPFWDDENSISVQVQTSDGDFVDGFDIPMKGTGDADTDAKTYVDLIKKNWSKVSRIIQESKT